MMHQRFERFGVWAAISTGTVVPSVVVGEGRLSPRVGGGIGLYPMAVELASPWWPGGKWASPRLVGSRGGAWRGSAMSEFFSL
ncbi:hypothetical protein JTB14_020718 [Gonioctena quinquepunctata]|nr:hypothetical protein JTB14_020718 [Gonioctena quinquepunctata]